jgi:hypothetical protein
MVETFPWWKFRMCLRCNVQAAYCPCDHPVVVAGMREAWHVLTLHVVTSRPLSAQQMEELVGAVAVVKGSVERTGTGCSIALGIDRNLWSDEATTTAVSWASLLVAATGVDSASVASVDLVPAERYGDLADALLGPGCLCTPEVLAAEESARSGEVVGCGTANHPYFEVPRRRRSWWSQWWLGLSSLWREVFRG